MHVPESVVRGLLSRSQELDDVVNAINATGYGLTFGLHTRIDDRVQAVVAAYEAGFVHPGG